MLDLKRIRTETDRVREAIALKKTNADLDRYLALDEERRGLLVQAEGLKHERNAVSEEIGRLKRSGQDAAAKVEAMKEVGDRIKTLDARIAELEAELTAILHWIPNVPHPSVPKAEDAAGNVVVRKAGKLREFKVPPKPHWELAESLGLLDFERAPKIAGTGFLLFTGRGARLERALIRLMIDSAVRRGYTEVWAPHLVRRECLFGTGQLPKLEEDMYRIEGTDLFLNPTAEVPITNIYRDEILDGE
ncbi:MAG: serine--tRNA ligase, partial [Candidatus Eisenbacteria bacterium]